MFSMVVDFLSLITNYNTCAQCHQLLCSKITPSFLSVVIPVVNFLFIKLVFPAELLSCPLSTKIKHFFVGCRSYVSTGGGSCSSASGNHPSSWRITGCCALHWDVVDGVSYQIVLFSDSVKDKLKIPASMKEKIISGMGGNIILRILTSSK